MLSCENLGEKKGTWFSTLEKLEKSYRGAERNLNRQGNEWISAAFYNGIIWEQNV